MSVQCSGGVDGIAAAAAGWCAGDRALRRGTDAMGRGFEFKVYDSSDPDYQARQHNVAREPLPCDDRVEDFCLVLLLSLIPLRRFRPKPKTISPCFASASP